MSNVRNYIVSGVEVWQGKSAASGFRTRLFASREAAEAEEIWLDKQWTGLDEHFRRQALAIDEWYDAHLRHAFEHILQACQRGAYPALTVDNASHDSLVAWRVCGFNEAEGAENFELVMVEGNEIVGALPYDLRQVEEFKREWRMRPARPSWP